MCLNVRSAFYNEAQRSAALRSWRFSPQMLMWRTKLRLTTSLSYEALHRHFCKTAVIASVFFFVRCFVGRFGCAVGQPHSLPSLGFSVGFCSLAMCVAVWVGFHTSAELVTTSKSAPMASKCFLPHLILSASEL